MAGNSENATPIQTVTPPPLASALQDLRTKWSLTPLDPPFSTRTGVLQKVRGPFGDGMLKLTASDEELRGYDLLDWWGGQGAVEVVMRAGSAVLMRFANGETLLPMSKAGQDGAATDVFLSVRARLHAVRAKPLPPSLTPLRAWFSCLMTSQDERLQPYLALAQVLLEAPCTPVPLHGDLHHDNIMDFGVGDWRAIDPKGLIGNPLYDLGAFFLNPDGADKRLTIARDQTVFDQRIATISSQLDVGQRIIANWVIATAALSAAWAMRDGQDPGLALDVITLASRHT